MNYVLYKILYFFKKFQVSLKQIEFPSTRSPPSDPKKFYFVEFYLLFKKKKYKKRIKRQNITSTVIHCGQVAVIFMEDDSN